jgi:putative phosphoesterase
MRIAVLADIHANLAALDAVVESVQKLRPDRVIVAGDFQNRGPDPAPVQSYLDATGWELLRGNHEDYVLRHSEPDPDSWNEPAWQPARWTASHLQEAMPRIRQLPTTISFHVSDTVICITHGSPRSNAEGIFPSTSDSRLAEMLSGGRPTLLCCGHTHIPLLRQFETTRIFNVGAVGFPFDGDHRASYGIIERRNSSWSTQLVRVNYALETTVERLENPTVADGMGPLVRVIRRELLSARPHLSLFTAVYIPQVRSGQVSLDDAVAEYLSLSQTEVDRLYRRITSGR